MRVSAVDQTCAMGAALFSAVAAGYSDLATLQERAVQYLDITYTPIAENVEVYERLYKLYRQLHDGFGMTQWVGSMDNVMKDLISIREEQRK